MPSVGVVFSCDANYFPLAKGLVLSLAQFGIPNAEISLNIADVGCGPDNVRWLIENGVNVFDFKIAEHYNFQNKDRIRPHYGSLLCRPLIPKIFPGHEIYVHIDADTWVQDVQALYDYIDALRAAPSHVIISPCVDASYAHEYYKMPSHVGAVKRLYETLYGSEAGNVLAFRPVLSCGVFAIHRDNPVWDEWKSHLDRNFDMDLYTESDRPASEQAALNFILYNSMKFTPLSASHNYNCHAGFVLRMRSTGLVSIGYPPHEKIGIIHLTCYETNRHIYLKHALLYDMGRYLSDEDRRVLKVA